MTQELRKLLEIEEVSTIVGLPIPTLYQQRHKRVGIGALALRVGRHLRWRPEDIERWLDEQTARAKEEAVG